MKLKYEVQVRLNGIDKEGNRIDKSIEEYFIDENPIVARKKAISKLQSYIDIFNDAKNSGQPILETWATAFEDNLNDFQIPDFELFYCPSEDEVNFEEFALYSYILLETREELYTEFKDELDFIKKHFPGIEVNTTQISDGGKSYFILADTPIMEL